MDPSEPLPSRLATTKLLQLDPDARIACALGNDEHGRRALTVLQKKPFTEAEVLRILWQLTSALAYCHHELHMLHRDLKPQNVFLSASGDVKLGDFGLAKVIEATSAQSSAAAPRCRRAR